MAKTKSNKNSLIITVCSVIGVVALVASYFIGYNVGVNSGSNNDINNGEDSEIIGAYKNSYYNTYNKSVDSYVILKENGACKYIESLKSELSATLNFDEEVDNNCSYTYEPKTKSGEFVINHAACLEKYQGAKMECIPTAKDGHYNFTYTENNLMVGGTIYSRIK